STLSTQNWSLNAIVRAIAISGSNVYITGPAKSAGNWFMYVTKLNTSASVIWSQGFGSQSRPTGYPNNMPIYPGNSSTFGGNAIRVDGAGNVYAAGTAVVSGFTGGMLFKWNSSGVQQWSKQIGYSGLDSTCFDVTTDASNNVYVGCTDLQTGN